MPIDVPKRMMNFTFIIQIHLLAKAIACDHSTVCQTPPDDSHSVWKTCQTPNPSPNTKEDVMMCSWAKQWSRFEVLMLRVLALVRLLSWTSPRHCDRVNTQRDNCQFKGEHQPERQQRFEVISVGLFEEIDKSFLKFIRKCKEPRIGKKILQKKNWVERPIFLISKLELLDNGVLIQW
jgi:hypothetical protein